MRRARLFVLTLALALGACAQPPAEPAEPRPLSPEDETAIRELLAEWDRAFGSNDYDALSAIFADDYVELRNSGALEGPAAAVEFYEESPSQNRAVTSTVRRIEGSGNLAHVWIELVNPYTRGDGGHRIFRGNGILTLRKEADGEWRFTGTAAVGSTVADTTAA